MGKFVVELSLLKDMGKIKELSKELALERLGQAVAVIETMKADMDSYTDFSQLWQAMDELHALLWGAEGDIGTAVLKKSVNGDQAVAIAELAAPAEAAEVALTDEDVAKYATKLVAEAKAKAVTPGRISALEGIAQQLAEAISEMAPAPASDPAPALDPGVISAEVAKALAPLSADIATLKADVSMQKATADAAIAKQIAAEAQVAELQKKLDALAANTTVPESTPPVVTPVKKSLWSGVFALPKN